MKNKFKSDRLEAHLNGRRIVDFVLSHPNEIVTASIVNEGRSIPYCLRLCQGSILVEGPDGQEKEYDTPSFLKSYEGIRWSPPKIEVV